MPLPLLNRIKAVRGYKASCRMAGRPSVVAPNRVQREFTVVKPNQVWVTDITYSAPGFRAGNVFYILRIDNFYFMSLFFRLMLPVKCPSARFDTNQADRNLRHRLE